MENQVNSDTAPASPPATSFKTPVRPLVDSMSVRLELVEGDTSGKVMMRGEFARCGVATANKRVYPQRLWEREIHRLTKAMTEKQLYGELDHPSVPGGTKLERVSHLITNMEIKDGIVVGEAQILDTARGRDLKAILEAGGRVGISSRGHGSTRMNEKGEDVVQDDYRLMTFDFVADPADQSAYPDVFYEEKDHAMQRDEQEMAAEFARKIEDAKLEGQKTAEASLREEFAKELTIRLGELRTEVTESVRGELLSDPAVGGAKQALESIKAVLRPFVLAEDAKAVCEEKDAEIAILKNKLAEQTLTIKGLEEDKAKLESAAKEAGYRFFVERQIAGDEDAALIRKLIGDVTHYANSGELKEKIQLVRSDLASKREEARKLSEQIEAEKVKDRERKERERIHALSVEKTLREENEKLRAALEKSTQANNALVIQTYAESRLANHPKAAKIRPLIESANPQSREEIDGIISQFREPSLGAEQLESVRSRVRNLTRGGDSTTPIEEETARPGSKSNGLYAQLGVSLGDLRNLAGMGEMTTPKR